MSIKNYNPLPSNDPYIDRELHDIALSLTTIIDSLGSDITAGVSDTIVDGVLTIAPSQNAVFDALSLKLDKNTVITGAIKTKITYDANGLVTSGVDATTSDIAEGSNLYFTDNRARTAVVTQSITNGGTTKSPSEDVVFDALSLKVDKTITVNGLALSSNVTVTDLNLSTSDITVNDVSITKHGFVPKAPNNAKTYLNGVGLYSVPTKVLVSYSAGAVTQTITAITILLFGTAIITNVNVTYSAGTFTFTAGGNYVAFVETSVTALNNSDATYTLNAQLNAVTIATSPSLAWATNSGEINSLHMTVAFTVGAGGSFRSSLTNTVSATTIANTTRIIIMEV